MITPKLVLMMSSRAIGTMKSMAEERAPAVPVPPERTAEVHSRRIRAGKVAFMGHCSQSASARRVPSLPSR